MLNDRAGAVQPTVVKYISDGCDGVRCHTFSRHSIGYVINGTKRIYSGDGYCQVNAGDAYYIRMGSHYMEDLPLDNTPFEQVVFFYTSEQLSNILIELNVTYGLTIDRRIDSKDCIDPDDCIIFTAPENIKNLFLYTGKNMKRQTVQYDAITDRLRIIELIYMILTGNNDAVKNRIFKNADSSTDNLEAVVTGNIFSNSSIESLAELCNRSESSFKKTFRKTYNQPPHKWLVNQRLAHAKTLLNYSQKAISEIAVECHMYNVSHFIKVFKRQFGITPREYRMQCLSKNITQHYS